MGGGSGGTGALELVPDAAQFGRIVVAVRGDDVAVALHRERLLGEVEVRAVHRRQAHLSRHFAFVCFFFLIDQYFWVVTTFPYRKTKKANLESDEGQVDVVEAEQFRVETAVEEVQQHLARPNAKLGKNKNSVTRFFFLWNHQLRFI